MFHDALPRAWQAIAHADFTAGWQPLAALVGDEENDPALAQDLARLPFTQDAANLAAALPRFLAALPLQVTRFAVLLDDANLPHHGYLSASAASDADPDFAIAWCWDGEVAAPGLQALFSRVGGDCAVTVLGYSVLGMALRDACRALASSPHPEAGHLAILSNRTSPLQMLFGHHDDLHQLGWLDVTGFRLDLEPLKEPQPVRNSPTSASANIGNDQILLAGPSWPANDSVKEWILAMAHHATAIPNLDENADKCQFAAEALADRDHHSEAAAIARLLLSRIAASQPKHPPLSADNLAKVHSLAGDTAAARAILAQAMDARRVSHALAAAKPKRPKHASANLADDFDFRQMAQAAWELGFPDLADGLSDGEQANEEKHLIVREARSAKALGQTANVAQALKRLQALAPRLTADVHRHPALLEVAALAGDAASAVAAFNSLESDRRCVVFTGDHLLAIDRSDLALAQARADVAGEDRPDFMHTGWAIAWLARHGEIALARDLVATVEARFAPEKHIAPHHVQARQHLARLYHLTGEPERARASLHQAHAMAEKLNDADERASILATLSKTYRQLGDWDGALTCARYVDGHANRVQDQAITLALAGRWDSLHALAVKVSKPAAAADLAWWIAISLDLRNSADG